MKFCMAHWNALRSAIDERGLSSLVAESGDAAASNLHRQMTDGETTVDTFDPLMGAHNAIVANALDTVGRLGGNPLVILDDNNPGHGCPLCYLNWASEEHDRVCTVPGCTKKPGMTFDDWIDRAADDMVAEWRKLGGAS